MEDNFLCEDCSEHIDLTFEGTLDLLQEPHEHVGLHRCQSCGWWGRLKEEEAGEGIVMGFPYSLFVGSDDDDEYLISASELVALTAVAILIAVGILFVLQWLPTGANMTLMHKASQPDEQTHRPALETPVQTIIDSSSVLPNLISVEEKSYESHMRPMSPRKSSGDLENALVMYPIDSNTSAGVEFLSGMTSVAAAYGSNSVCHSKAAGNGTDRTAKCQTCERVKAMCEWVCEVVDEVQQSILILIENIFIYAFLYVHSL